mmetsp:Transcript_22345/g.41965  ORF Transcript_22345/g.41965 Transcript_22345/m.41965 type:complete len:201 (-) Transcript_22345:107-709(-)
MSCSTSSANASNDGQHQILRSNARVKVSYDANSHVFRRLLQQSLRGKDMFNLRGANTEGKGAKSPVSGGVAVSAHNCHSRLRETLLRSNNMHNALTSVLHAEILNSEFFHVGGQGLNLEFRLWFANPFRAVSSGNIMIGSSQRAVKSSYFSSGDAEALESLRAGYFMDKMSVDVDKARAVLLLVHHMAFPNLIKESLGAG